MQPPRIPDDESQRLDALRACAVLDTPPEARFDRLTWLAARLFDVPIALVSLIDAERQWFKSRVGLDATQTGRDISFCGHAILSPEILEIPDALLDARFADNPLVTGAPGIRFYAGAPLRVGGDHLVGTLCLIDTRPRQLDDAQRQSLRDLADCVQDELLRVHEIELRQQLERQMMFAETISLAQNSFIRETDRSRSFDSLLEAILGLTQSAFGFIGEVLGADEQAPYLKVHAISQLEWQGEPVGAAAEVLATMEFRNPQNLFGAVLRTGEAVIANDPAHDPRRGGLPPGHPPLKSFLGLPIHHDGRLLAMVGIANRPGGYDRGLIEFLDPLLVTVGQLVQAARTSKALALEQEALAAKTEALARSNAELEQFAYVASHDLRQPLRMVNSYVQMLEKRLAGQLDEDTRRMMGFATEGARRMDQMLVSLLEYSRVGRTGEPMAMLDTRQAVDEALRFLGPAIAAAHAHVAVAGEWPRLHASRNEFSRLFQNLIGNAIKYRAPDREPEIVVRAAQSDGHWRFLVADNGIGIDPAQFDRLFRVFQRLHSREQYEGTGVGLAVCRKIVERHGGRIWVESDGEGRGARFCFELPATAMGERGDAP